MRRAAVKKVGETVCKAVVRQGKASFRTQRMGQIAIRRERGEEHGYLVQWQGSKRPVISTIQACCSLWYSEQTAGDCIQTAWPRANNLGNHQATQQHPATRQHTQLRDAANTANTL
jgi:hypothetical protein